MLGKNLVEPIGIETDDLLNAIVHSGHCDIGDSLSFHYSALRRMFSLARQGEDLVYSPHIQQLDESDNVRQGFLNPGEFVKLHDNLPAYLKPIIEFLYLTGMRSGAARGLRHKDVDIEAKVIRLPVKLAKNKKPQLIPLSGRLLAIVKNAYENRSLQCPYLFHHEGQPIGDFRKAFDSAATAAGMTELLPHDLRRSAIRNLVRAGVKETVAMRLSGHRTRSVFDRYNIVSEDDLIDASKKLEAFLAEAVKESKIEKLKK